MMHEKDKIDFKIKSYLLPFNIKFEGGQKYIV
jgi:hypothetical protein